ESRAREKSAKVVLGRVLINRDCSAIADCHKQRMRVRCSGDLPPSSPPAEKTTARQDQARQSCASDVYFGEEALRGAGPRQRNILWIISLFIAVTKTCPISSAMPKSRDAASRASDSIAGEGSGISVVFSSPLCRIVIANWATGAARAVGCDTFCSWTCAMPPEHGVGIVLPLTSGVWCEPLNKIIRRKLIPSLEHVTASDPTVTLSRFAISSRLMPSATNSLIFSITCGVNLTGLPLV